MAQTEQMVSTVLTERTVLTGPLGRKDLLDLPDQSELRDLQVLTAQTVSMARQDFKDQLDPLEFPDHRGY